MNGYLIQNILVEQKYIFLFKKQEFSIQSDELK